MLTSKCPRNLQSGTSPPPPGGILPTNTVSPKTTGSRTVPPTTPTSSSHRYPPPSPPKAAPLVRDRRSPSQQSSSGTPSKNLDLIGTIWKVLTRTQGKIQKGRPLDWVGSTIREISSSIEAMPMQSSIPRAILLPSTKVNIKQLSAIDPRGQQEQVHSLWEAQDVFLEDGWGQKLGAWALPRG